MSQKVESYHKLLTDGCSFFDVAGSIFSRSCKEKMSPALFIIFTGYIPAHSYLTGKRFRPSFAVDLLPVYLLRFLILFARKPKNPV
jgi:hypothetical protein